MPNQASSADVLIVGAGPVGLTLAATLAQRGLNCRLIDKAPAPSDKSKALVVWSRSLELLDNLGLAETFISAGLKIRGASIYGEGQRRAHIEIAGADSPFGFPLMIPQSETERLLTKHLSRQGVTIERQIELTAFHEDVDQVACTLRHADGHEETCTVPWLIGCDGAHSTVRHALGLPFTGAAEPNDWILADVHVSGPIEPDEVTVYRHEKGVLAFFPIAPPRFRVIADIGLAKTAIAPPNPTLTEVQAMVGERGPGSLILSEPVWLSGFRINERKVSDYRRGRVMLAGDAAHIHSPAGGQGMNTGMQDAFNLAWKLALVHRGSGRPDVLLDSYSRERSAIGDQVLRGASMLTLLATLRNPVAQFVRDHVAGVLTSFSFVQDKIRNAMCELSINYRHGPLAAEDWPWLGGGVAAGDRLPDAPLTSTHGGEQTTLFAALRGTRHNLLLFPCSSDRGTISRLIQIAEQTRQTYPNVFAIHLVLSSNDATTAASEIASANIAVWHDVDGRVHQQLGATDRALLIIRPDGYIGYRGQPADSAKLFQYLDRYLVRRSSYH